MCKIMDKFWMSITAILTVILLIYLFPIMYSRYGAGIAILLSVVLVFGMSLYYVRGYWIGYRVAGKKSAQERNGIEPTESR